MIEKVMAEVGKEALDTVANTATDVPNIEQIKSMSLEALEAQVEAKDLTETRSGPAAGIPDIEQIKCTSLESLEAQVDETEAFRPETKGLTDVQKQIISEQTGWSHKITDWLTSMAEAKLYLRLDLVEVTIGEKTFLCPREIDLNRLDDKGRTNAERANLGLAVLDKDGNSMELHHIGQSKDSPLALLTYSEHRQNTSILHPSNLPTEVHGVGNTWNAERQQCWKDIIAYAYDNGGRLNV